MIREVRLCKGYLLFAWVAVAAFGAGLLWTPDAFGQTAGHRAVTIISEPGAIVWLDDLRYGRTDKSGTFKIEPVPAGATDGE